MGAISVPPVGRADESPEPAVGRAWPPIVAAAAVLLTLAPYFAGFSMANGRKYMWLGYNLDDGCVYLAWMRQAAEGAILNRNLFTTEPQHGMAPNALFWILGRIAALTHLPLAAVFHGSRVVCGFALLMAVWALIRAVIRQPAAQRMAFLFVCFSAGLGWLPGLWTGPLPTPVDTWQPEAITFLSLYLSPLFCFSMLLQVTTIYLIILGDRSGRMRHAAMAGLCGFVLGLTHTYDVISLAAVLTTYLAIKTVIDVHNRRPLPEIVAPWFRGLTAGIIALPAVLYIAYQLRTETVFQERANVATLSPALAWVLMGYGLTLVLAIIGVSALLRDRVADPSSPSGRLTWLVDGNARVLMPTWMIMNVAVSYVPVAFQRKLLQGAHFPIAILAGVGAVWLFRRIGWGPLHRGAGLAAVAATAALCPTNVLFLQRDIDNYAHNTSQTRLHRTYLQAGEIAALDWIRAHSTPGTAIQPLPWIGQASVAEHTQLFTRDAALLCFTPGLIDRAVYCGHWGETPDFIGKLASLAMFASSSPRMTDEERYAFALSMHVRFLVFSQKRAADTSYEFARDADVLLPRFRGLLAPPDYLKLRYSNPDADVYEIVAR